MIGPRNNNNNRGERALESSLTRAETGAGGDREGTDGDGG